MNYDNNNFKKKCICLAPIMPVGEQKHHNYHQNIRSAAVNITPSPRFECITWMVFAVLVVLVILNMALYYKLWTLEEAPPYTLLDLHVLKYVSISKLLFYFIYIYMY